MTISRPRVRVPALAGLIATVGLCLALTGCGGGSPAPLGTSVPATRAVASVATGAPVPVPGTPAPVAPAASPVPAPAAKLPSKPPIVASPIPFGPRRKAEMLAYVGRHYHLHTYRLIHPRVIVEHFTGSSDYSAAFNTFAPDVPDSELHELPGTCAHFVVDRDGTIHQLVSTALMCRHTVGLNWTAIGIEQVGNSDAEILGRPRQVRAVLALTSWLRCRFKIHVRNVIGHNESLSSPFHHEDVAALRTQTHDDWRRADMLLIRARLRALGGCPS